MKKTISATITTLSLAISSGVLVPAAFAQSATPNPSGNVMKIDKPGSIPNFDFAKLVTSLLSLFLFIAALVAFVYLLWGGFQWITSGGDKGNIEAARNKIQAALLGLLLVFASYAIFTLVTNFLGIPNIFGDGFVIPSATN